MGKVDFPATQDGFRGRVQTAKRSIQTESTSEVAVRTRQGLPYRRIEIAFSGSVEGCVAAGGPVWTSAPDRYSWFYDVPQLCVPQEHLLLVDRTEPYPLPLDPKPQIDVTLVSGRAEFKAADGAGMTVFLPATPAGWNQKLFLVQHGSGTYTPLGPLIETEVGELFPQGTGANLFVDSMIDLGFAVAYQRKDAGRPHLGLSIATLEDGSKVRTTFVAHVGLALAMAQFAQDLVSEAMGSRPRRTYFYGHSGGGITARVINFSPFANETEDAQPIIDGFLVDDAGNGLYLPVAFEAGKDVVLADDAAREAFRPQIDICRQLYNPVSYLEAKRATARILRDKGLAGKHRYYEVRGVSHFDAGQMGRAASGEALDLGAFIEAMVVRLDSWVENGLAPSPSRADAQDFEPAISLPEVALPLGVFFSGAEGFSGNPGSMRTSFAAFDGQSPEPMSLDTGTFVDMNGNGIQDRRETVTEAWRRLGLLGQVDTFTEDIYLRRMAQTISELVRGGWMPAHAGLWYVEQASHLLEQSGARC